ncbi:MAG: helix-turn-helix domain-containing protein [Acidobacteriota bacterium]|nr:helix-turn-helix domain-containing protein [Acidobacteriota bacterium]
MTLAPLSSLDRESMETRRLAAATELLNGTTQSQVARRYGVSRTTASRWHRSIVLKGMEGLRKRRATGRPSRLTADQVDGIRAMYLSGAMACGFSTDRWTTGKLAGAIERKFGIRYDQDHVGRLMHKFGLRERRFVYAPLDIPNTMHQNAVSRV